MKIFQITENDAHQRLDKFLKKFLINASISFIYKLNRTGKIKVQSFCLDSGSHRIFSKKPCDYKLQIGDTVKIFLHEDEIFFLTQCTKNTHTRIHKKFDPNTIVYQDSDILVIDKVPGINVHSGDHKTDESNVISQIHDFLGKSYESLSFRPSLVHRLDRDTSGALIIAKKKSALTALASDFKNHKNIKKTYYAIVVGKLSRKNGVITKNIKRKENPIKQNKVEICSSGQQAITHYRVLAEYKIPLIQEEIYISEIEVEIHTGRMHQIRVHMSSIGNPIAGDTVYGNKKLAHFFAKHFGLERQALHSWKIEFFHPTLRKNITVEANRAKDLSDFLKKILFSV